MKSISLTIMLLLVASCSLRPVPSLDELAALPVVRVGESPPTAGEYVLFYPAGASFPLRLSYSGGLFTQSAVIETACTLNKDLYIYKYWASHDGKIWKRSHSLLQVELSGGFDVQGLQARLRLEPL